MLSERRRKIEILGDLEKIVPAKELLLQRKGNKTCSGKTKPDSISRSYMNVYHLFQSSFHWNCRNASFEAENQKRKEKEKTAEPKGILRLLGPGSMFVNPTWTNWIPTKKSSHYWLISTQLPHWFCLETLLAVILMTDPKGHHGKLWVVRWNSFQLLVRNSP